MAESSFEGSNESSKLYTLEGALSTKLAAYLDNSELADITIKYGQRLFRAHRLILGSWSDKLTEMMDTSSADNILELDPDATEQEVEVFKGVLRCMYTGEISFSEANVKIIMELSKRLGLKKLGEMARNWVGERMHQNCLVDAITWMRDKVVNDLPSLRNHCVRTLAQHFQYIPQASWCELSEEEVFSILDHPDIVAKTEENVIKRIDDWLEGKPVPENKQLYQEMANRIRLPFARAYKLIRLQKTSSIIRFVADSDPKFISDALQSRALAYEYYLESSHDSSCAKISSLGVNPRLYLQSPTVRKYRTGRGHKEDGLYVKMKFDKHMYCAKYYVPMCVQDTDSSLIYTTSNILECAPKLVSFKTQNSEAWRVQYDITQHNLTAFGSGTFRVIFDAKPLNEDNDFYLPDHPTVTICENSFKQETKHKEDRDRLPTISVTTPPIFAGKKPRSFLVASFAYVNVITKPVKRKRFIVEMADGTEDDVSDVESYSFSSDNADSELFDTTWFSKKKMHQDFDW